MAWVEVGVRGPEARRLQCRRGGQHLLLSLARNGFVGKKIKFQGGNLSLLLEFERIVSVLTACIRSHSS